MVMQASPTANPPVSSFNRFVLRSARLCKLLWAAFFSFVFCLYVAVSPMASKSIYDMLVLPRCMKQSVPYAPVTWQGVKSEDCWINVGSRKLHAWLFKRPGAKYLTILHHGQCGNVTIYEPFVEFMLAQGTSVLEYDYEGYGRSQGTPDLANLCKDGIAAYNYARTVQKISPDRIVHFGISLGTGVACNVAKDCPSAGVILMSPYANFLGLAKEDLPLLSAYPDFMFPYYNIETLSFFRKPHAPVLMFAGGRDLQIHITQPDAIMANAVQPVKYIRIPEAKHVQFLDDRYLKQTFDTVRDFLNGLQSNA
jgi:alpha-beta hydrolase superfamily lysophospholipase